MIKQSQESGRAAEMKKKSELILLSVQFTRIILALCLESAFAQFLSEKKGIFCFVFRFTFSLCWDRLVYRYLDDSEALPPRFLRCYHHSFPGGPWGATVRGKTVKESTSLGMSGYWARTITQQLCQNPMHLLLHPTLKSHKQCRQPKVICTKAPCLHMGLFHWDYVCRK